MGNDIKTSYGSYGGIQYIDVTSVTNSIHDCQIPTREGSQYGFII